MAKDIFKDAPFDNEGWGLTNRWYCTYTQTYYPVGTTKREIERDVELELENNIEKAKQAWRYLDDVCVDHYGCTDADHEVPYLGFYEKGTDREDIWHDIEDMFGVSVAWLMGEAKNPDGTNE